MEHLWLRAMLTGRHVHRLDALGLPGGATACVRLRAVSAHTSVRAEFTKRHLLVKKVMRWTALTSTAQLGCSMNAPVLSVESIAKTLEGLLGNHG